MGKQLLFVLRVWFCTIFIGQSGVYGYGYGYRSNNYESCDDYEPSDDCCYSDRLTVYAEGIYAQLTADSFNWTQEFTGTFPAAFTGTTGTVAGVGVVLDELGLLSENFVSGNFIRRTICPEFRPGMRAGVQYRCGDPGKYVEGFGSYIRFERSSNRSGNLTPTLPFVHPFLYTSYETEDLNAITPTTVTVVEDVNSTTVTITTVVDGAVDVVDSVTPLTIDIDVIDSTVVVQALTEATVAGEPFYVVVGDGTASMNLRYWDAAGRFGQYLFSGCDFDFHAWVGGRYLVLKEEMSARFVGTSLELTQIITRDLQQQRTREFNGGGPEVGFGGSYNILGGLYVQGSLAAMAMIGNQDAEVVSQAVEVDVSAVTHTYTQRFEYDECIAIAPGLELRVGLGYRFTCDSFTLQAEGGYTLTHYWNLLSGGHDVASPNASDTGANRQTDFGMAGPYFNLTFAVGM